MSRLFLLCRLPTTLLCGGLHVLFFLALPWMHAHLGEGLDVSVLHAHSVTPVTDVVVNPDIHGDDGEAELAIIGEFFHLFHAGVATFSYASSRLVDLQIVPHSSEFVIPANLLYPPVLATRPVAQIGPICPLRPLSSGERARLLGTDLPPPTA